ncbi:hypothetical protein BAU18_000552 [Enterococcus diestrammenae]|uniref:Uncharacterized protein n=1 Tax=Enterococcus diestrammenae TaxID=1155073 RepID=A0ABV0EYT5_9ENTE
MIKLAIVYAIVATVISGAVVAIDKWRYKR